MLERGARRRGQLQDLCTRVRDPHHAGRQLRRGSWEDVAALDRLCDDVGLDTIETGAAIAVLMDAGGMEWGDAEG